MTTLRQLSVQELLAGLRGGRTSTEDVAASVVQQLKASAHLNCFTNSDPDLIIAAARELDARGPSTRDLPLYGIPLVVKDNINTANYPTTGATPALHDHRTDENAAVVQRLVDAGAFVVGKTNMHELAFGITTNNACTGATRNPYDTNRIAGGSSGGSGAAVSAGIAPIGLGTDTGGSARIPAALCGTIGFRPTTGRYPNDGLMMLSSTRDTAGIFGRCVADVALVDRVITDSNESAPVNLSDLRIGIARDPLFENLDSEVAACIDSTIALLREHKVTIVERDAPEIVALDEQAGFPIVLYECIRELERYLALHAEISLEILIAAIASPDVSGAVAMAYHDAPIELAVYEHAVGEVRLALQDAYASYFRDADLDAMIYPTTILCATPLGMDEFVNHNGASVPTFQTFIRNTDPSSVAGVPSLSLPIGLGAHNHLPIGMCIDGPMGSDAKILAIAAAFERVIPSIPPPAMSN